MSGLAVEAAVLWMVQAAHTQVETALMPDSTEAEAEVAARVEEETAEQAVLEEMEWRWSYVGKR